ncbi:ring finger protein [Diplodia corticola]|uniref:Ring finger protein n=1 Tax=Diplodia corticola TaxID=236234 RepID=A0A1J9SE04_9PEZI|nr:ring finger protein [Diplodia corticola]OJD38663.1 ring finger protein [Diplodia corticola]
MSSHGRNPGNPGDMPSALDTPQSSIILEFPEEPLGATPIGSKCSFCTKDLPVQPCHSYKATPIQLPCGCVMHYGCILLWFETQAANPAPPSFKIRLSCFNCGGMIDHPELVYREGENEPYVYAVCDEQRRAMVLTITLVLPRSMTATCDPKDTTFGDPSRGFPQWHDGL